MRERNAVDTILHIIEYLLPRLLLIVIISGVLVFLILSKVAVHHPITWLDRDIRYIFIALWVFAISFLSLGAMAVRKLLCVRIARQLMDISLIVFQKKLERVEKQEHVEQ